MKHTETDKLFEKSNPHYYIYDKQVYQRKCYTCHKKFETRLEMNQFCSPACKEKVLKT